MSATAVDHQQVHMVWRLGDAVGPVAGRRHGHEPAAEGIERLMELGFVRQVNLAFNRVRRHYQRRRNRLLGRSRFRSGLGRAGRVEE